ncbi:hypothetical protein CS006_10530 [Bifidobacterium primatium]|uniref:Uncharacterized protein n=2 Tax=Bifidobacterium TaxID=1678 RepID=A0A2M9H6B5_9BIFI|nr:MULTISPECIES: hypothetical protein [Bifidobacterium]NEG95983.1 hypothetical protein [Bifidobacterium sp. SMB2]NEH12448.1 hypothetical protein [Bifidobacterium saimiriisciurei]PJM72363.1 hypothetical protein CS006_10530 [Bifidobacterium primatium]
MPQHIRNWPKRGLTLTAGVRGGILLALTFLEGWLVSFCTTHDRLPAPLGTGTPQWMVTGTLLLALIVPFLWYAALGHDRRDDGGEDGDR